MSLDSWIIDELERERRREERAPNVLELELPLEEGARPEREPDPGPRPSRGVTILDISPIGENVIKI